MWFGTHARVLLVTQKTGPPGRSNALILMNVKGKGFRRIHLHVAKLQPKKAKFAIQKQFVGTLREASYANVAASILGMAPVAGSYISLSI